MIQAYLVTTDKVLTQSETDIYLSIRESKFGIVKEYPQMEILQDDGSVLTKNAELGAVKSQSDANVLLSELQNTLSNYVWKIEIKNYPAAQNIYWYEKG
jgi:hypothetical protein